MVRGEETIYDEVKSLFIDFTDDMDLKARKKKAKGKTSGKKG